MLLESVTVRAVDPCRYAGQAVRAERALSSAPLCVHCIEPPISGHAVHQVIGSESIVKSETVGELFELEMDGRYRVDLRPRSSLAS